MGKASLKDIAALFAKDHEALRNMTILTRCAPSEWLKRDDEGNGAKVVVAAGVAAGYWD